MSQSMRNFGFPRWGGYGRDKDATTVRMCDYSGCTERGDCPAPKSPNSPERWYFCKEHAAEYNRNWNFFDGLSEEDAAKYAEETSDPFTTNRSFEWGGAVDENGVSSNFAAAFDVLELDTDASDEDIKRNYRKLAKQWHPDANPNDPDAARRFHEVQTAYDLLQKRPK